MNGKVLRHSLCILLVVVILLLLSCAGKKEIISIADKNTTFSIVAKAKPAPFSKEPNFYGYLRIDTINFESDQIDNIVVFCKNNGEFCVVYKTADGRHILICSSKPGKTREVYSASELFHLSSLINQMTNIKIVLLGQEIILDNMKCALLNWRSRGINIFVFDQFEDGLISTFSYKHVEKANMTKSGKIIFTDWDREDENWPEIKELRFPFEHY
jgi:hypothetical protein